jgi:uncharacterized protein (TIGR03790 family)
LLEKGRGSVRFLVYLMLKMSVKTLLALACTVLLRATSAAAQSADNILLVINDASPDSVRVGEYYAQKRAIPKDHLVRVGTKTTESIERADYERTIEAPIAAAIVQRKLHDRILYIVLTKGMPLMIRGTQGKQGVTASVDSELTLLYRRMVGQPFSLLGTLANPYYLGDGLLATAKPFTHFTADIYLVTRLDGFTVDDVIGLIDRAASPSRDGKIVLDERGTLFDPGGDKWLVEAAERLRRTAADRVLLEDTKAVASYGGPVLGYYSWGSNDPANHLRQFGLKFVPGALAAMFVSTDGRTFVEPAAAWIPGEPNGRSVGSGTQSLAGDLIRDGVTGVAAHVTEPYLDATIRPQILFPVYLQGFNLAESFYMAMPYLSWQSIVVGDPLCAPFARTPLSTTQLHQGLDPDTELPALFSERQLALMARSGLKADALKLLLKAQTRSAQGESAAAVEPLLVRAADLEPRLTAAQMQLAIFYESIGQYEKAIDRYRRGLTAEPNNPLFLNNLAYVLAVHANQPADALPLAERAFKLSLNIPESAAAMSIAAPTGLFFGAKSAAIADTLGWIRHLLGDNRGALAPLEAAVKAAPLNAELLTHLAIVHEALGDPAKARAAIDTAAKSDPKIEQRDDVKALRRKLAQ